MWWEQESVCWGNWGKQQELRNGNRDTSVKNVIVIPRVGTSVDFTATLWVLRSWEAPGNYLDKSARNTWTWSIFKHGTLIFPLDLKCRNDSITTNVYSKVKDSNLYLPQTSAIYLSSCSEGHECAHPLQHHLQRNDVFHGFILPRCYPCCPQLMQLFSLGCNVFSMVCRLLLN